MEIQNSSLNKELTLDKDLLKLMSSAGKSLNLVTSVIEKDYYVTQVIHSVADLENEHFRLIFCGGTCLSKAHRAVNRMSEDVDFKIQLKNPAAISSKLQLSKALKKFRLEIKSRLDSTGLKVIEPIVRNEGKYVKVEIDYPSVFLINQQLRPHILVEFTLSNVRLTTERLAVKTLIENTLNGVHLSFTQLITCVGIEEAAIEKWVGLTRRIIAIERGHHSMDDTLIRHVYDLNSISKANRISDAFFRLAKDIITQDAAQFKYQHPEYATNPSEEILASINLLKNNKTWKRHYENFLVEMVYDLTTTDDYQKAITNIETISVQIINSLQSKN